jgi:hypothetical protein
MARTSTYKFRIGQAVNYRPSERGQVAPEGTYAITRQLAQADDGGFEYGIMHSGETHERIVKESELRGALIPMSKTYQGYDLVSLRGVGGWQIRILRGGKSIVTKLFDDETSAVAEAKKIVDEFWNLRRSGPAQKPPPSQSSGTCGKP